MDQGTVCCEHLEHGDFVALLSISSFSTSTPFRVANARVELERAQTNFSGKPCKLMTRDLPALGCDTLSGRLYLYFECLGVGVAGLSALAAERTSSFVNTAKWNGCDSRK